MNDALTLRELTAVSLPALLELATRSMPHELWTARIIERRLFQTPGFRPSYGLSAWHGERLVGALLGMVRSNGQNLVASISFLAVDPDYYRSGIASKLLEQFESHAQAENISHVQIGLFAPNWLWPGLDVRYTPALCFFQHHGYQRFGEAYNLRVDLSHDWDTSAEEQRLAAEGWQIRQLHDDDQEAFGAWLGREWNDAWQYEGLASYENNPHSTFIALYNNTIQAFASYNVSGFANTFGPTGTAPAARGHGVGRVLYYRCLAALRAQGHTSAEVGWVGPIAFYTRSSGAYLDRVFWALEKQLGS